MSNLKGSYFKRAARIWTCKSTEYEYFSTGCWCERTLTVINIVNFLWKTNLQTSWSSVWSRKLFRKNKWIFSGFWHINMKHQKNTRFMLWSCLMQEWPAHWRREKKVCLFSWGQRENIYVRKISSFIFNENCCPKVPWGEKTKNNGRASLCFGDIEEASFVTVFDQHMLMVTVYEPPEDRVKCTIKKVFAVDCRLQIDSPRAVFAFWWR